MFDNLFTQSSDVAVEVYCPVIDLSVEVSPANVLATDHSMHLVVGNKWGEPRSEERRVGTECRL